MESCDTEHNGVVVRRAVWSALRDLLAPILEDETETQEASEAAVAPVTGTRSLAKEISKGLVCESAIFFPIGTYVVMMADKIVSSALKQEGSAALFSTSIRIR